MSSFSFDEKKRILLFIVKNSSDPKLTERKEKWQELAREMDRDWEEIRNAYLQWQKDESTSIISKEKSQHEHIDNMKNVENTARTEIYEMNNDEIKNNLEEEVQYVDLNSDLFDLDNFEDYILHDPEVFNSAAHYTDKKALELKKRQLDLNDFDLELLKTFESQSNEELELKRKEHEKKMKLYKLQLDFATEVHQEKMKILKIKLEALEEQMYHIDHVICNKNLRRKFKSGPI